MDSTVPPVAPSDALLTLIVARVAADVRDAVDADAVADAAADRVSARIDASDIARALDLSDLASEVVNELDLSALAGEIDVHDVAAQIDASDLADAVAEGEDFVEAVAYHLSSLVGGQCMPLIERLSIGEARLAAVEERLAATEALLVAAAEDADEHVDRVAAFAQEVADAVAAAKAADAATEREPVQFGPPAPAPVNDALLAAVRDATVAALLAALNEAAAAGRL
jgi:hypothetical protein